MWRWQSVQEFQYPLIEYLAPSRTCRCSSASRSVVARPRAHVDVGHHRPDAGGARHRARCRHAAAYTALGNANALAQWEYCFDRGDTDTSRGNSRRQCRGNNWDCSVPGSANAADPSWNATAQKLIPAGGAGTGTQGHNKTLEALKWMAAFHPDASYYVPAHLERAGQFNPDGNNGFNVEHLRDFNNAAPRRRVRLRDPARSRRLGRPRRIPSAAQQHRRRATDSVGGTTYGGTGVYGAQIGGVWDALLGEGRNFWFFASSDWHNRGSFGPDDRRTTQDFYPGEYQRNYTLVRNGADKLRPQTIVDGLRTRQQLRDRAASSSIASRFVACGYRPPTASDRLGGRRRWRPPRRSTTPTSTSSGCATMGEKLVVPAGPDIVVGDRRARPRGHELLAVHVRQPVAAAGRHQPAAQHAGARPHRPDRRPGDRLQDAGRAGLRRRMAAQHDWLQHRRHDGRSVGRPRRGQEPDARRSCARSTAAAPRLEAGDVARRRHHVPGDDVPHPGGAASQYVRLRGTNLPPAVPFETDASGNPLADVFTNAEAYTDRAAIRVHDRRTATCAAIRRLPGPPGDAVHRQHIDNCRSLPVRRLKYVAFDVAAWADLWFYSNPIYIEVSGSTPVAGREVTDRLTSSAPRGDARRRLCIRRRHTMSAPPLTLARRPRRPRSRRRRCGRWLREPLLHFVVLGGAAVRARPRARRPGRRSAHDRRRRRCGQRRRSRLFKAARGREPNDEELDALRRVWLDNEVLYREGLALQVDKGDAGDPRARDLQGAERRRRNVKLPPADDACCASGSSSHRDKYDEPARYDFEEACSAGDSSEAAVREFVDALNAGTPGDAKAGLRVFKGRPAATWCRATAREFATALEESPRGRVARTAARATAGAPMRLDAAHRRQAGELRSAARRGAARLDRRHGARAAHRRRARAGARSTR